MTQEIKLHVPIIISLSLEGGRERAYLCCWMLLSLPPFYTIAYLIIVQPKNRVYFFVGGVYKLI